MWLNEFEKKNAEEREKIDRVKRKKETERRERKRQRVEKERDREKEREKRQRERNKVNDEKRIARKPFRDSVILNPLN